MIKQLLLIGLGGFAGSILRYLIYIVLDTRISNWPWATFAVNVTGGFLLGMFMGHFLMQQPGNHLYRLIFAVGFCGSFTTFSTFAFEAWQLMEQRLWFTSILYMTGSVALSVLAVFAGIAVGKQFA